MADTTVQNFINGEPVDAADGRRADLIDPSTGEVFGTAPISGPEDVDRAYRAAADAFETWRDTHSERAAAGPAEVRRRARVARRGARRRRVRRTPASRSS